MGFPICLFFIELLGQVFFFILNFQIQPWFDEFL